MYNYLGNNKSVHFLNSYRKQTCNNLKIAILLFSVAWVRERTILTEWPPLVGEVSANFCGNRVPRGQHDRSLWLYSRLSGPEPLLFFQVAPQLYSQGKDLATSGAPITINGEICLKSRGNNVGCGFMRQNWWKYFSDSSEESMVMNCLKLAQSEAGIGNM
jgi:hypothetical protein